MVKTKKNILKRKISNLILNKNKSNYKSKFSLNRRINSDNKKSKTKYNGKKISKLQKGGADDIEIKHFWYRKWPDHEAPNLDDKNTKQEFVDFVDNLYDDINSDHGNTVIHCSAGVGRTGTLFVILKICLERKKKLSQLLLKIEEKSEIVSQEDIDNAIIYARMRRNYMVQAFEQYEFLLKLFGAKNINRTDKDNFNFIGNKSVSLLDHKQKYGKLCKLQNRYGNILPYDKTRVIFGNDNDSCINYINANYLNEALQPISNINDFLYINTIDIFNGIVIGSECPKKDQKQNFLRMLEENDIIRIVMLTGLCEGKTSKCDDYTGDKTTSDEKNTLSNLEKESYTDFGNLTEYTLKNDNTGNLILTDGKPLKIVHGATANNSRTSPNSSPRSLRSNKISHPFGTLEEEEL